MMNIPGTGIPDRSDEQAPHSMVPALRRDGNGDSEDAMASMREFMHPEGTAPTATGNSEMPVNMNPDISAGNPSVSEYGMARGEFGTNC